MCSKKKKLFFVITVLYFKYNEYIKRKNYEKIPASHRATSIKYVKKQVCTNVCEGYETHRLKIALENEKTLSIIHNYIFDQPKIIVAPHPNAIKFIT